MGLDKGLDTISIGTSTDVPRDGAHLDRGLDRGLDRDSSIGGCIGAI